MHMEKPIAEAVCGLEAASGVARLDRTKIVQL